MQESISAELISMVLNCQAVISTIKRAVLYTSKSNREVTFEINKQYKTPAIVISPIDVRSYNSCQVDYSLSEPERYPYGKKSTIVRFQKTGGLKKTSRSYILLHAHTHPLYGVASVSLVDLTPPYLVPLELIANMDGNLLLYHCPLKEGEFDEYLTEDVSLDYESYISERYGKEAYENLSAFWGDLLESVYSTRPEEAFPLFTWVGHVTMLGNINLQDVANLACVFHEWEDDD